MDADHLLLLSGDLRARSREASDTITALMARMDLLLEVVAQIREELESKVSEREKNGKWTIKPRRPSN